MIKTELNQAFSNGDYQKYINVFSNYLQKGMGLDTDMIIQYAKVLIKLKRFDEAANILIHLIPVAKKHHFEYVVASQLSFCSKLDEAEDLMLAIKNPNALSLCLLGRIYLINGKVKEAKNAFLKVLESAKIGSPEYTKATQYLKKIENHEKYGAFIKRDYLSFAKQGKMLEPGHIIYLKQGIEKANGNMQNEDSKTADRPHMIYKIDGETLYVFAITTNNRNQLRKLAKKDYPNFDCDRYVKDNLLITTIDNVSSVDAKVNDEDFQRIMKNIFKSTYFGSSKEEKEGKDDFLKSYVGSIETSDIIEFIEPSSREIHFYYVIDKTETEYKVVEINPTSLEVLNSLPKKIKTSRLVYNVIKLSKHEIAYIFEQLPDSVKYQTVVGAIINYNGQDMIVISETPNEYFCIDTLYSSSYMNLQTISKQEPFKVKDFVADEEFAYIKKLVNEKYLNDLQEKSKLGSRRRKKINFI